jgi:hypothetical protein
MALVFVLRAIYLMDVGDAKLTVKVGNFNFWDYVLFVQ